MYVLQSIFSVAKDSTLVAKAEAGKAALLEKVTNSTPDELLADLAQGAMHFGLKVLAAILIYVVGGLLIKWVRKIVRKSFTLRKTDATISSFTLSFLTVVMWIVVLVIAIGTLGVETTSLAALLAAGGMAIGMALSGTVQNFAGGIMILAFKPFKAGDYIEAQGYSGTVNEVNITATKITTVDNKVIILPNGILSNGVINNYSKMKWRRVDFTVCVEYGSDADEVMETLLSIARADERVTGTADGAPADPFVGLAALNASSVDFVMRLWVKSGDYWGVFYDTNKKIYREFPEKGIVFPFPQIMINRRD